MGRGRTGTSHLVPRFLSYSLISIAAALRALGMQVLCGLGQPFFTNAPAKLATEWFGVKQRAVATTVGAMFNPIGIALGQVLCFPAPHCSEIARTATLTLRFV